MARLRARQLAEQAAAAPDPPAPAKDFLPAAAWANLGADKPENAIQTFFWAGNHGETNLVRNLLRWQKDGDNPVSDELDAKFARGIVSGATRLAGESQCYRVTSQQEERTEIRLGIELTNPDGKAEPPLFGWSARTINGSRSCTFGLTTKAAFGRAWTCRRNFSRASGGVVARRSAPAPP